ncbi:AAA family ATPase [Hymenobacter perfusus]|uniref:Endonuclease GajA/Old nuclease/RecF-like AAA domain-containing protein n=1 Tax=Hymenobacter perfusus TaxID=1236770 RepID=A0A3R9P0T8_9BACT|nr:AAA family ATPase [Hymenobacter perfusus]RSK46163.1 hypothetical protein EI293_03045 [Hymenobacter perfusus]
MNEQLIVKNFGPIKDATVDFKKVTVFIGPTGGGKSTLAKLAAIFRNDKFYSITPSTREELFKSSSINTFFSKDSKFTWTDNDGSFFTDINLLTKNINNKLVNTKPTAKIDILFKNTEKRLKFQRISEKYANSIKSNKAAGNLLKQLNDLIDNIPDPLKPTYIPAERIFSSTIEYSLAGILINNIGLPKLFLNYLNELNIARKEVKKLKIDFLNITYIQRKEKDYISLQDTKTSLRLFEAASGIQSVTPLMILIEHLTQQKEQAQSFIIEEPELNLYPTAQQGLLNWLVEKCTTGENDLTITTHSPYILSHLNLLLYAYQVAEKHPDRADDVAKLVPRESWIDPDEFAAYYVNGPEGKNGVRSLVDNETKLISQNGLDTVSGIQADIFDQLLDINSGF